MQNMTAFLVLILVLVLAVGGYYFYRQLLKVQSQLTSMEKQIRLHSQSISGLTAGALGVSKRLRTLQDSDRELAYRQDTMETQNLSEMPYEKAIRLVQQGASSSRLVEELGLSESEAMLIEQLHAPKSG